MFFNGFEKAVFRSLKLLMALLGSSCCFLGKSGAKMGFQIGYQEWKNSYQKFDFKLIIKKDIVFLFYFGFRLGLVLGFEARFGIQTLFKIC